MQLGNRTRTGLTIASLCLLAACGGGGGGQPGASQLPPPVNRSPELVGHTTDQSTFVGQPFAVDVNAAGAVFTDPDGGPLTYTITFNGSTTPPPGLTVSGSQLSGTPVESDGYHVIVQARDSGGLTVNDNFSLLIRLNSPPQVVHPNEFRVVQLGTVDYDPTQNDTTFNDPEGQTFTYRLSILTSSGSFTVDGTRLKGEFTQPGFVKAKLEATDELGGVAEDIFALVVPVPLTAEPTLPSPSFIYGDTELALPTVYTSGFTPTLHDTTRATNEITNAGATLGRVLFYDKRLSITNTHSCSSCHRQGNGFADPQPFSIGAFNEATRRNAMALTNVRYNLHDKYFGDERVETLEALALMPIQSPTELGSRLTQVVDELSATDFYPPLFKTAFGTPEVTGERISLALAQFLRSLISYRARFDEAFHMGVPRETVLTDEELRGQGVFTQSCVFCHKDTVHTVEDVFNDGLDILSEDPGAGTGRFRTSSLRNIAASAPYMHDGRFATLSEVIEHYSSGIKAAPALGPTLIPGGFNLSLQAKTELEAFLNTLTDTPMLTDPKFSDPF
jgi:cytochrome c peroxidase